MKLKLVSDGTDEGTKIVDAATGEAVENLVSVFCEVGKHDDFVSRATFVLELSGVEISCDAITQDFENPEETGTVSGVEIKAVSLFHSGKSPDPDQDVLSPYDFDVKSPADPHLSVRRFVFTAGQHDTEDVSLLLETNKHQPFIPTTKEKTNAN